MKSISVLIVDDDEDIRETIAEVLEEAGYPVATARNGVEALQHLRDDAKPRLILLDLSMPVMSGGEFRDEQLADPTLADITTVVMTAADRPHEKTAKMRVAETLAKPIKLQQLLDTVERYCESPKD